MSKSGNTTRLTISLPNDLASAVRRVAGRRGVSESMTEAARLRLHLAGLADLAADIAGHTGGPYTDAERAAVDRQWSTALDDLTGATRHRFDLAGLAEIVAEGEAASGPLTEDERARASWEFQHAWDRPVASAE